mmetsp:Transcript_38331/g.92140  ORF Transcript_38331/g.92140 Transcript_38331/m.92140 type:complete len:260 (-) Transcript_38331:2883-3662(-)
MHDIHAGVTLPFHQPSIHFSERQHAQGAIGHLRSPPAVHPHVDPIFRQQEPLTRLQSVPDPHAQQSAGCHHLLSKIGAYDRRRHPSQCGDCTEQRPRGGDAEMVALVADSQEACVQGGHCGNEIVRMRAGSKNHLHRRGHTDSKLIASLCDRHNPGQRFGQCPRSAPRHRPSLHHCEHSLHDRKPVVGPLCKLQRRDRTLRELLRGRAVNEHIRGDCCLGAEVVLHPGDHQVMAGGRNPRVDAIGARDREKSTCAGTAG